VTGMGNEDDIPQTFREVGIYLRDIKNDQREIKNDQLTFKNEVHREQQVIKSEVDDLKKLLSKLLGIFFTSIIAPLIVAIILAYVLSTSR
jgi:hypothetical protein